MALNGIASNDEHKFNIPGFCQTEGTADGVTCILHCEEALHSRTASSPSRPRTGHWIAVKNFKMPAVIVGISTSCLVGENAMALADANTPDATGTLKSSTHVTIACSRLIKTDRPDPCMHAAACWEALQRQVT